MAIFEILSISMISTWLLLRMLALEEMSYGYSKYIFNTLALLSVLYIGYGIFFEQTTIREVYNEKLSYETHTEREIIKIYECIKYTHEIKENYSVVSLFQLGIEPLHKESVNVEYCLNKEQL